MAIEISLGWWLIPAAITVASFGWAWWVQSPDRGGDYNFTGLFNAMLWIISLVPPLAAWLIWALLV